MTAVDAARSYRPGQWFGIFGDHATVLLPPSEKARVGTLWALVDDGAGFDVVLDALISEGLRDLPGFVLVATVDGETKVVLRGDARAWFTTGDDTHEVAGADVTTWAERTFPDVTATRLVVGADDEDGATDRSLPIDSGLVRVSEVQAPPASSERPGVDAAGITGAGAGAGARTRVGTGAGTRAGAGTGTRAGAGTGAGTRARTDPRAVRRRARPRLPAPGAPRPCSAATGDRARR